MSFAVLLNGSVMFLGAPQLMLEIRSYVFFKNIHIVVLFIFGMHKWTQECALTQHLKIFRKFT